MLLGALPGNKIEEMRFIVTIIYFALFMLLGGTVLAQQRITGKVMDSSDESPLPGVNIIVKSTNRGTITDVDGIFELMVREEQVANLELIVSFIGMEMQIVKVNNRTYLEVFMQEEVNELDQIVITSSYGTKKLKEEVVGSIETLQSKDIQVDQAFESVDKMLEGQIAGVNIETGSGALSPVKINIRGQGSLTPTGNTLLGTSTQPLIIIDGVIMSEEMAIDNAFFDGSGTTAENFNNPMGQLAPEDIESINVLKDAAAVSIYGADGANGVILINTKKGKAGKANFNFSTQHGVSHAINQIQYLNGEQYNEVRNAFLGSQGIEPIPYNGVNTNWFDELNGSGAFNKYALSVSGGHEAFTFRVGLNYLHIKEPQRGNSSDQYRVSTNLGYNTERFQAQLSFNPSIVQKEVPNVYYGYAFVPTLPIYNDDGTYTKVGVTGLGNPFAAIEQNLNKTDTRGFISSLNLKYNLTKDWIISSLFGIDYKDKEQDRYFSGGNESGQLNGSFELDGVEYPLWGRRTINQRNSTRWNWQAQTNYQKQINDNHYFDVMAGIDLAEEKVDFEYASGRGFVNPEVIHPIEDALQDEDPQTEDEDRHKNQTYHSDINYNSRASLFAQLNYDFKKKYFFLANFRRDESSVFGDDTNVAYNGGIGASWIISKESFLEQQLWLDFLRLRVSYGTTGNSRIGSYSSKGLYSYSEFGGYNKVSFATPNSAPNPLLTWETNKKFNVGLDVNFASRFNLTVEYFYDDIEDLITNRDIPSETGYSSIQINGSDMYNKGWEASLRMQIIKNGDFKWNVNFNMATLKSKITSVRGFGDDYSSGSRAVAIKEGYSTSTIWGLHWAGIDPATGRDLVEVDGQVYDSEAINDLFEATDWVPIGNAQAKLYGGFNTSLTYKSISLSIRGSYKYGGDKLVDYNLVSNYNFIESRNLSVNAYDYWRQPGDLALQPTVSKYNPIIRNLDKYLYDTSHLKISNISLSYKVPIHRANIFIKDLKLMADVSNVAYFYKDKSPKGKNGIREYMYTYPQSRTFTLGLKMNF